jgi:transcription elongation factor GreA
MTNFYLTKERLSELKTELENLKTVKRQEIADLLRQAKDYGDLSENSAYTEAREAQNTLETKIAELEDLIKNAVIIDKKENAGVVVVGSVVTVEKEGQKIKYQIVGSDEANPTAGKISNDSPLGKAFLGHVLGDKILVTVPVGTASYVIVSIE